MALSEEMLSLPDLGRALLLLSPLLGKPGTSNTKTEHNAVLCFEVLGKAECMWLKISFPGHGESC